MDMTCAVLIALFGVLCCYYDAEGVKYDDLEVDVDTDIHSHAVQPNLSGILRKKRQFTLGGNVGWRGRPTWGGSLGYNFGQGYSTGLDYSGSIGHHRFGANIGYQRDGWSVKGYGHVNTRAGWGVGASVGYRWKRSLSEPKPAFYLRVEANPCQFMLYDRDRDAVITIDKVSEVFSDRNLANGLFERLDIEGKGKITEDDFEAAKASGAIVGCAVPAYKERTPDESELMD